MTDFSFLFSENISSINNPILFFENCIKDGNIFKQAFENKLNEDAWHVLFERQTELKYSRTIDVTDVDHIIDYKEYCEYSKGIYWKTKIVNGTPEIISKMDFKGKLTFEQFAILYIEHEVDISKNLILSFIKDLNNTSNKIYYLNITNQTIDILLDESVEESLINKVLIYNLKVLKEFINNCYEKILPPKHLLKTSTDYKDYEKLNDEENLKHNIAIGNILTFRFSNRINNAEIKDLFDFVKPRYLSADSQFKNFKKAFIGTKLKPEERINWIDSKATLALFLNFLFAKLNSQDNKWEIARYVFLYKGEDIGTNFGNNRSKRKLPPQIYKMISF